MFRVRSVFLVGFVGGVVGYACSSYMAPAVAGAQTTDGGGLTPAEPGDAGQPPSNTVPVAGRCLRWEVKVGPKVSSNGNVDTQPVLLDEGWEPFAVAPSPNSNFYWDVPMLRRCVK